MAGVQVFVVGAAVDRVLWDEGAWTGPGAVDWQTHAIVGTDLLFPQWWNPGIPHFLLHALGRLTSLILGAHDPRTGFFLVSMGLVGAYAALLFALFHDAGRSLRPVPQRAIAAGLSLAVGLAESPSGLLGWSYNLPPDFFIPLSNPASPTSLASRPFSLLLVLVGWRCLQDPSHRLRPLLPIVVVLSMLVKPVMPVMVLVAALIEIIRRRSDPSNISRVRLVWLRIGLPVAVVGVIQVLINQAQRPIQWVSAEPIEADYGHSFVIRPLTGIFELGGAQPVFWGVVVFPLLGLWFLRGRLQGTLTGFGAVLAAVGMIPFIFLYGNGHKYSSETLNYAQQGFLLLTVLLVSRIVRLVSIDPRRWGGPAVALGLAGAASVVSGTVFWSCADGAVCLVR